MARAARDFRVCWGRHLLPALPDFGPERPSSRLDDTWCPPIITEHFATISSGCGGARARSAVVTSSALLMVASRSRQRATPRHVGARLAVRFALRSPQRTPAPSPRFSCAWVLPPEAAASSGGIQQLPAGRQEDLRPQLHQLALAWHAGKGTKDELSSTDHRAPFAVILAKNSSLRQRIAVVSPDPDLLFHLNLSV